MISVLWANKVTAYVECLCGLLRGRKVNKNNTINKKRRDREEKRIQLVHKISLY